MKWKLWERKSKPITLDTKREYDFQKDRGNLDIWDISHGHREEEFLFWNWFIPKPFSDRAYNWEPIGKLNAKELLGLLDFSIKLQKSIFKELKKFEITDVPEWVKGVCKAITKEG